MLLKLYCVGLYSTVKLQAAALELADSDVCCTEKEEEEGEEKRVFPSSPPPPFPPLSFTIRFLEPAHAIGFSVCLCAWLVSALSLSPLLHSTPLSHFTAPLGSSLHSNRTIMQPVWSTTTTLHDSATTIELLQQVHCRLCIEPLLLLLLLLRCVWIIPRLFTFVHAQCDTQVCPYSDYLYLDKGG